MRRAAAAFLAGLAAAGALAGCGGGGGAPTARPATAPAAAPLAAGPWTRALEAYCRSTLAAIARLARAPEDRRDETRPVAVFARRYRAGLERFGRVAPPAAERAVQLQTLAAGRESADRLDDGVRFGRRGDTDAATSALEAIAGLLPDDLPAPVLRLAPACGQRLG